MKARLTLLCLLAGARAFAGDTATTETAEVTAPASSLKISYELEGDYAYIGSAKTELGNGRTGEVDEQNVTFRAILAPQWGEGPIFRFGLGLQRSSFGLPSRAPLPNTLESAAIVLGMDLQLFNSWLVRIEAEPGFYSDFHDLDRGDFNVPFIIGGSYIASADLQWVIGVSVDVNRRYPVIPGVGLRWHFARALTLNAVLPTPRLEYEWSKALTLYAGADIRDGTYRVSESFGKRHGSPKLDDAIVEYEEVRVGGGLTWKAAPGVQFELEGGYLPYREFNYHRAEQGYESKSGAAYGRVGLSAKF